MTLVASPEQRAVLDQVSGLMSLLEGHGDVTMGLLDVYLVPNADRFARCCANAGSPAQGVTRLIQQLVGLEAKINQYEQGERFIAAVERAGGTALLDRAWRTRPAADADRDPRARALDRSVRPAVA
ncbi:MAG: zinc-dependent metalloprotease [Acidimicrobiales bacterium]